MTMTIVSNDGETAIAASGSTAADDRLIYRRTDGDIDIDAVTFLRVFQIGIDLSDALQRLEKEKFLPDEPDRAVGRSVRAKGIGFGVTDEKPDFPPFEDPIDIPAKEGRNVRDFRGRPVSSEQAVQNWKALRDAIDVNLREDSGVSTEDRKVLDQMKLAAEGQDVDRVLKLFTTLSPPLSEKYRALVSNASK